MAEQPKSDTTTKEDVEKNKTMAILAWFIFFLPLITDAKESKFAKFHANQSLLVVIMYLICFPIVVITVGLGTIIYVVPFIFWILGIMSAANGEMKRLPVIGGIDLIK